MKNITRTALIAIIGNTELSDCDEVSRLAQNTNQFENYSLTLRRIPNDGLFLHEDQMNGSEYYLVAPEEAADPVNFLRDCASEWAGNSGESCELEMLAWSLISAEDLQVGEDYEGKCKIIIEGNYYGYSPIDYAKDEMGNDIMIFDDRASAQNWINDAEGGVYYTQHNEAGRPTYTIVEA